MPSSYTTSLRLTLPATGELSGQWGNTVNTGITELLDAAVAGTASISTWGGAGVAYTLSNNSGTADEARKMFIVATGSPGEAKNVICPAVSKFYVFRNDTTGGFALTLKTSGGTGISVPAGQYKFLYCDGTNVVEMFNSAGALTLSGALSVGGTATFAANPTLSAGTANQVQYLNGSKVLSGSANLTFDGTTLTGAGFSGPLNGSVGATTPSTGAFTTLSASSSVTLSGGTANGVAYANASKVLTTGSALTFDGSVLTLAPNQVTFGSSTILALGSGSYFKAASTNGFLVNNSADTLNFFKIDTSGNAIFYPGGTEGMRLTSTGLGIGTSSPAVKLDVSGSSAVARVLATAGTVPQLQLSSSGVVAWSLRSNNDGASDFTIYQDSTQRLKIDSSGNVGIGTSSPSTKLDIRGSSVGGNFSAISVDNTAAGSGSPANTVSINFSNAGVVKNSITGAIYGDGYLAFATNDNTEKMRLTAAGNLGLGVTPSAWSTTTSVFENPSGSIYSFSGTNQIGLNSNAYYNGTNWIYRNASSVGAADFYMQNGFFVWRTAVAGTSPNIIAYSEQMRLTSTGLGIGTSSPNAKLEVNGNAILGAEVYRSVDTSYLRIAGGNPAATGANVIVFGSTHATAPGRVSINAVGTGHTEFSTGGAERMRLDSSGNLGIGTSSPQKKLVVSDAGASGIEFSPNDGGTQNRILSYNRTTAAYQELLVQANFFRWGVGASGTEAMRLDSSGNLGLGGTPSAWSGYNAFQIADAGSTPLAYIASDAAGNTVTNIGHGAYWNGSNWLYTSTSVGATRYQMTGANAGSTHAWYVSAGGTAGNAISFTQAMTLDASGNLLVGTTSSSGSPYRIEVDTTSDTRIGLKVNTTLTGILQATANNFSIAAAGASGVLTLNTNSAERARITSGGDLGVGETNPLYRLTVKKDTTSTVAWFENSNASAPNGPYVKFSAASPNNATQYFLYCEDSTAQRATIRSNGGFANYSGNDVNLSDRREKTNFAPAKSYLDTICAIPVQTFEYIDQSPDDPGLTLGVVAQDVQAVAPELVMESNWGTEDNPKMRLSIYQTDLQYALMKCIQEQQALITALTARVAALEKP